MAYKFSPYLKTNDSYYGPKGNLGSYEHANRLFVDNNLEFAPKVAFLYHVAFVLNPAAKAMLPGFMAASGLGINEIGLLVKNISLPKFTPQVETLNRYNQKKNIQTKIVYDPVTVQLHDDKKSLTTALLQAYYKYYFVDGNYSARPSGYNPDNVYASGLARYGLDARIPQKHFFREIHVSQLSRGNYTRYTLVNPILSKFDHDDLDYSEGAKALANSITIQYEAVFTETGQIKEDGGEPDGFTQSRYDHQPSTLSFTNVDKDFNNVELANTFDLQDAALQNKQFENEFKNRTLQQQQRKEQSNLTFSKLRRNNFNTNNFTERDNALTSGLEEFSFPKVDNNQESTISLQQRTKQIVNTSKTELLNNPAALESARRVLFRQQYQAEGGTGNLAAADAEYAARSTNASFLASLDSKLGI